MSLDRAQRLQFLKQGQELIHQFRDQHANATKKSLETLWKSQDKLQSYDAQEAQDNLLVGQSKIEYLDIIQTLLDKEKQDLQSPNVPSSADEKKVAPKPNAHHVFADFDGVYNHQLNNPNSRLSQLSRVKSYLRIQLLMGQGDRNTLGYLTDLVKKEMCKQMLLDCRVKLAHMIADAKKRNADLIIHVFSNRQSRKMDDHNRDETNSLSMTEVLPHIPSIIASMDKDMHTIVDRHTTADTFKKRKSGFNFEQILKSNTFTPQVGVKDNADNDEIDPLDPQLADQVVTDDTKISMYIFFCNQAIFAFPQYVGRSFATYDDRGKNDILDGIVRYIETNPHLAVGQLDKTLQLTAEHAFYEFPAIKMKNGTQETIVGLTPTVRRKRDFDLSRLGTPGYEFPIVHLIGKVQGTGKPDPFYHENYIIRTANFMGIKLDQGDVRAAIEPYLGAFIEAPLLDSTEENPYHGDLPLTHQVKKPEEAKDDSEPEPVVESANPPENPLQDEFWRGVMDPGTPNKYLWPQFFVKKDDAKTESTVASMLPQPSALPRIPLLSLNGLTAKTRTAVSAAGTSNAGMNMADTDEASTAGIGMRNGSHSSS